MALRIVLVRHARTEWHPDRRLQGWQDVPLSPEGRAQAEAVARLLAARPLGAVYSSPLRQALETAEAIALPHQLPVQQRSAFREMGFGEWEGLTGAEIEVRDAEAYRRWVLEPHRVTPPDGEGLGEVRRRVLAGLDDLRARHAGQTVAVVAHGISGRLLILEALGLGPERLWSLALSSSGVSELEFRDDWTAVHQMNTLVHLDGLPAAR